MSIIGYGHRNRYVGDTVVENRGTLDISRPINNGIITDWEAMEDFWEIMYYDLLMTPPEDHGILHTEPADNPPENRAKLIEVKHLSPIYSYYINCTCILSSIIFLNVQLTIKPMFLINFFSIPT